MQLRQLFTYARPYRGRLLALAALSTASSLVLLGVPWLAGRMLAGIVSGSAIRSLTLLMLAAALVLIALLNFANAYQATRTAARILVDLRAHIYDHIQRLPLSFHESRGHGELLAVMTYEVARLSNFLTSTLVAIPSRLLTTIGAVVLMFRIDARLALIVPVAVPAFYILLKIFGRQLRGTAIALQEAEARVVALANEAVEILPATKAFAREESQAGRYQAALDRVLALATKEGRAQATLEPMVGLVAALAALAILWFAGGSVEAGRLDPAQAFSFLLYAALLTRPVGALANVYGQVQVARGTLTRLQSVLEEQTEPQTVAPARAGQRSGAFEFRRVHFAYPGRPPVLQGVDFAVAHGEIVALVGANGAGKTTIINLLMRFYEPASGTIRIGGEDVAALDVREARRRVGLVPQSAFLFNGTIRENIAFGADSPTEQQIGNAVRLAQASAFIEQLPAGMDTIIGDRGLRLSGGQRQRIALARALVGDPPILIFDEATSMFDQEGESGFVAACRSGFGSRTVMLVTHRPATLALAHRVLLLSEGQVTEVASGSLGWSRASA